MSAFLLILLIAAAFLSVVRSAMFNTELYNTTGKILDFFDFKKLIYFCIMFFAIKQFKKHPIVYIAISAAAGILLSF